MKREVKLTPTAQQQQEIVSQSAGSTALEFSTAEELIRHDAVHTPVPPKIAERLGESIGPSAPPGQPWWQKLFRKNS